MVLWFSLSLAGSALASNSEPNPSIIQYATKNHINLRAEPNTQATVKGILMKGDAVAVKDATADWVYVFKVMNSSDIALAGETGFVHRSLLTNRFVERDKANDPALSKKLAEINKARDRQVRAIDERTSRLARYMETVLNAEKALSQNRKDCGSPLWGNAANAIGSMEALSDEVWRQYQSRENYSQEADLSSFNTAMNYAAQTNFKIADLALKQGCLDIADERYRHVVTRYTGTAYAAFRDRARIGIDDVRDRRKR